MCLLNCLVQLTQAITNSETEAKIKEQIANKDQRYFRQARQTLVALRGHYIDLYNHIIKNIDRFQRPDVNQVY